MTKHFSKNLCKKFFDELSEVTPDVADNDSVKRFSFFDDPIKTLDNLSVISSRLALKTPISISCDLCRDVSPYVLLDALIRGADTTTHIDIPSEKLQKVISTLNLEHLSKPSRTGDHSNIWPIPVIYGRAWKRDYSSKDIKKEIRSAVDSYTTSLDSWLQEHDVCMTSTFLGDMENQLYELLDNADHAYNPLADNTGGDWAISGFMTRRDEQYVCHISVITLGYTIYETLSGQLKPINPMVSEYLEKYIQHERSCKKLSKEALVTAAATHSIVTNSQNGGGTGLTDFLYTFADAAAEPESERHSVVISGNGHVRFQDEYFLLNESLNSERRQAFNKHDSISFPPDSEYVYHASHKVAGTIVGVRFFISSQDLQAKCEDDHEKTTT